MKASLLWVPHSPFICRLPSGRGVNLENPALVISSAAAKPIFIVEDNAQVRNLTRLILRAAGYEVIEAIDGLDALEKYSHD